MILTPDGSTGEYLEDLWVQNVALASRLRPIGVLESCAERHKVNRMSGGRNVDPEG